MAINKKELIDKIAEVADTHKKDVANIIDIFTQVVTDILISGDSVHIVGFGTFEVRERASRTAKNPRTGESIQVEATKVPAFKAGKAFKDTIKNA